MKRLRHIVRELWRSAPAFRLALLYLVALLLLVLLLPWLGLSFAPNSLDLDQVYQRPFDFRQYSSDKPFHWLGTDGLGRDLLANVLYGARTAFSISLPVMLLASMLGVLLGATAGLYGNRLAKVSRARLLALVLAIPVLYYYAVFTPAQVYRLQVASMSYTPALLLAFGLSVLLLFGLAPLLKQVPWLRQRIAIPTDELLLRLIEVQTSIPRLVLILVLAATMPPTLGALSVLLVLTFWTGTARLARAEMLRITNLPFFEAARGLGVPRAGLILWHALPHLLAPVMVAFTFGLAGLLMLESTLSFLNIGVSTDLVSWGRMIAGIRANTAAWWLVVIPSAALAVTVLALQTCSYYLLRFLQKKN